MGRPITDQPNACLVIPWLHWGLAATTVRSMSPRLAAGTMLIDNRGGQAISAAWNRGRAVVLYGDPITGWHPEWLIVCSTATTFGAPGGDDLLRILAAEDGSRQVSIINAGWHLHAIPRRVLDIIGPFDEGYTAYCEDSGFIYRHKLAGLGDLWKGEGNVHVSVDCEFLPDGHSVRLGLADPGIYQQSLAKYRYQWGGLPRQETYLTPFNRKGVDWRWTWLDEAKARGWPLIEVSRRAAILASGEG